MKKLLFLVFLATMLGSSTYGQIRIDTLFIENDTIVPNPADSVQTLTDTITSDYMMRFQGISTLDPSVSTVYWRVSFDGNDDGNFSTLYETGPIVPGPTPDTVLQLAAFLELGYGTVRNVQVELTTDPGNFGQGSNYTGFYNKIIIRVFNDSGGRVTMGSKKKDGTGKNDFCDEYIALNNRTLEFFVYNWRDAGLTCVANDFTVSTAVVHYRDAGDTIQCTLDLDPDDFGDLVTFSLFDDSDNIVAQDVSPNASFDIATDEKARFEMEIGGPCGSIAIDKIEKIEVSAVYSGNCYDSSVSATFCIGCQGDVVYFEHSTSPSSTGPEDFIPPLTLAINTITLVDNVTFVSGDSADLVVSSDVNNSYIHAKSSPGILLRAEPGTFFRARRDTVCIFIEPNETNLVEQPSNVTQSKVLDGITIYPNPFHTSFFVNVKIEQPAPVTIVLLDILGRKRQILQLGEIHKGELQGIEIQTASLPAGLYYCQVQVGDQVHTKSIVKVE